MQKMYETPSPDYMVIEEKDNTRSDPLRNPKVLNATLHQVIVFLHRYASRTTLYAERKDCFRRPLFDMAHGGPSFMPWHRFFFLLWERQAARIARRHFNAHFALPYWDWTNAQSCEVCTDDLVGDLSAPNASSVNPFKDWEVFCEPPFNKEINCVGCHSLLRAKGAFPKLWRIWKPKAKFPSRQQVEFALSRPSFFVPFSVQIKVSETFHL